MSNLVTNTILPAVNSALTSAGLATISSSDIRAITTGPAVNIYLNLDMRPNGVAGTVSKAQYVVAVPAIANALKGIKDTNTTYNPAGAVALFDIVRGRPLGTGVNDPNLGRLTDDLVGQDSGDVFAILKTGYNFDGSQGTAFVVRKGDTATTALASGLMSDTATSLTVTGTVTPGAQNSAFPTIDALHDPDRQRAADGDGRQRQHLDRDPRRATGRSRRRTSATPSSSTASRVPSRSPTSTGPTATTRRCRT